MPNSLALTAYRALAVAACLLAYSQRLSAQNNASAPVVVQGEEVPSSYGAPPDFSRSRFSNLTNAYVLPPGAFYIGEIYEGDAFRNGPPDHLFTQEVEVGLPYRFGIAAETTFEAFNGGRGFSTASIEARYALADWNKIPLNPTLFFEYKSGVGPIRHDEGPPPPPGQVDPDAGTAQIPSSYEVRLLLAQDFGDNIEWAMNFFLEKENTGDRGREWGIAQSAIKPIILPNERLKVGVEMQYQNFTVKDTRGDPLNRFIIGPTVAWKPSANTRIDISPLFGCTQDSPHVQVFAVFSWLLGGSERQEAEAPTSTRNR